MTGSAVADDWRDHRQLEFFDVKGAVEVVLSALNISGFTIDRARVEYLHPGQSAVLSRDGVEVARFGRLHPRVASLYKFRQPVFVGEIEFDMLLALPADQVRFARCPDSRPRRATYRLWFRMRLCGARLKTRSSDLGITEIVSVRALRYL